MGSHKDDALTEMDPALGRQIRRHFQEARQAAPVPGFDALMAQAQTQALSASQPSAADWLRDLFSRPVAAWAGSALLAGALGVFVFFAVRPAPEFSDATMLARLPASVSVSQQQLVLELNSSTRWQAPSDRWPTAEADLDILGLPDLNGSAGSNSASSKKESTWL